MKTMHQFNVVFISTFLVLLANGCYSMTNMFNDATINVRIVDDAGVPLEGVMVEMYSLSDRDRHVMTSDANGLVSRHMENIYYDIGGYFTKSGYYMTSGRFWKWNKTGGVPPASTNFIIVMKRIVNPVPMIRRSIRTDMPKTDDTVSFDLAIGDWTAPYGKGTVQDISFTSSVQFETRSNFKVKVAAIFNDPLCGSWRFSAPQGTDRKIQSKLMAPQTAPDNGYEKTFSLWRYNNPVERGNTHEKPDNNYVFRTRVVTNAVGKIVSANYAWTVGDIKVDTNDGKRPWIGFTYYYNPDPKSQSLEPKEIADRQPKDFAEIMAIRDAAVKRE